MSLIVKGKVEDGTRRKVLVEGEFGVSRRQVRRIINRECWNHIQ